MGRVVDLMRTRRVEVLVLCSKVRPERTGIASRVRMVAETFLMPLEAIDTVKLVSVDRLARPGRQKKTS